MGNRESIITDFDDEFVYAEWLAEPYKGQQFKIPKYKVGPAKWIAKGEHICYVEHGYWNFCKMFDIHKNK